MHTLPNRPRLALLLLPLLAACAGRSTDAPPAAQSGAELYASQNCALCHGADGSSAFWRPGPDLLPHLAEWTVEGLAAYIADPLGVSAGIARLDGDGMPAYELLDLDARLRLAAYVLSLAGDEQPDGP